MADTGLITLTAFVSPYRRDRDRVRKIVTDSGLPDGFIEVFVDRALEVSDYHDPKGLYKKARAGEIANFTGISDPYEAPESPEFHLDGSTQKSPEQMATEISDWLHNRGVF